MLTCSSNVANQFIELSMYLISMFVTADPHNLNFANHRFRKPEKGSEHRRLKSGSVDSTPLLSEKFKHAVRSGRKGRWSVANPAAANIVRLFFHQFT